MLDVYVADWSAMSAAEQQAEREGNWQHLTVYSVLFVGFVVLLFARGAAYMQASVWASKTLHDRAFAAVMACDMRFFDTQPIGRILNRYAWTCMLAGVGVWMLGCVFTHLLVDG